MAYRDQFTTRHVQFVVVGMCFLSLITAYIAEYGFGIMPCDFCVYERVMYGVVLLIGALSFTDNYLFTGHRGNLIQLFFLGIGIVLTVYHVGMEQQWWEGPASCMGAGNAATLEAFRDQLMKARPRCDQVNWAIFGISATVWNLSIQAGLIILTTASLYLREECPE